LYGYKRSQVTDAGTRTGVCRNDGAPQFTRSAEYAGKLLSTVPQSERA
jgi:hypothetical protein